MRILRFSVKVMVISLIMLPMISGCVGDVSSGNQIWIDYPQQGGEYALDSAIPFIIHYASNESLGEVRVKANQEVIYKGPSSEAENPVLVINQEWVPEQIGDYTIEVEIYDEGGRRLSQAQVDITVLERIPTLLPDLAVVDIGLDGPDRIWCKFINLGGAVLPAGRDIWIDIILGPADSEVPPISRSNIGVGDNLVSNAERIFTTAPLSSVPTWPHLVTCRIDVDGQVNELDEINNALAVTLTAPPVTISVTPTETQAPPPTTQAPPPTTEAPPPTTEAPPPTTEAPPPDTTPPNISGMSAAPERIAVLPCAQNTVTISAQVSDRSGVNQVKLYYRAIKENKIGEWQISSMAGIGGNQYQVDIGPEEISASYSPYGGLILQYYIKAWDTLGNFAQNNSGNLPLDFCVQ